MTKTKKAETTQEVLTDLFKDLMNYPPEREFRIYRENKEVHLTYNPLIAWTSLKDGKVLYVYGNTKCQNRAAANKVTIDINEVTCETCKEAYKESLKPGKKKHAFSDGAEALVIERDEDVGWVDREIARVRTMMSGEFEYGGSTLCYGWAEILAHKASGGDWLKYHQELFGKTSIDDDEYFAVHLAATKPLKEIWPFDDREPMEYAVGICGDRREIHRHTTEFKKVTCKKCKALIKKDKKGNYKAAVKKLLRKADFHKAEAEPIGLSRTWQEVHAERKAAKEKYAKEQAGFKKRFPYGFPTKAKDVKFDFRGHFDESILADDEDEFGHFNRQLDSQLMMAEMHARRPNWRSDLHKTLNKNKKAAADDAELEDVNDPEDDDRYLTVLKNNKVKVHGSCLNRCYKCGEEVAFILDLKTKKAVAENECVCAKGIPPYSVEMDIPSGKIIFANDLRHWIDVAADYDVNYVQGQRRTAEAYAANQMFHFSVGNTCPGIYMKDGFITIGNPSYNADDDDDDADVDEDKIAEERAKPYGKKLGSICTDLWWWCGVDYNHFKKVAGKDFDKVVKDHYTTVVKVKPGRYKATGLTHLARAHEGAESKAYGPVFDIQTALNDPKWLKNAGRDKEPKYKKLLETPKEKLKEMLKEAQAHYNEVKRQAPPFDVLSTIERIGDCTGDVFGAKELENQEDPGFEEYIKLCRLAYPGLYPTRGRVLDHTFCTIGNGLEWRNGSLYRTSEAYERARKELASGAKVEFRKDDAPETFYPMCEYSRMASVPDDVKPDWLAGVYETIDLVLKTDPNVKSSVGHENKANIEFAKKVKADLDKRFGGCPKKQKNGNYKFIRQPAAASA